MRTIMIAAALVWLIQSPAPPDIAIVNARVFTGNRAQPWAEAVAVRGNRIAAVGSTANVRALAGSATRVIDAGERLLIPGLNDAHVHPGAVPPVTRLAGPPAVEHDPTLDEVLSRARTAVAAAPPGGWILGEIGANVLEDPRATRETLDGVAAAHPLLLQSWTGHGVVVNTAALRALRIRDDEPDPPGGRFARAADGRTLAGRAEEYASYLLSRRLTESANREAQIGAFSSITREAAGFGITSLQAMTTAYPLESAAALSGAADLRARVRLIDFPLSGMSDWQARSRPSSPSPLVTISGTKWILDGTPVERLMFLRAPYADMPGARGRLNFSIDALTQFLRRALEGREQPIFHAVGDGAITAVLDALDATGGERWKPLRPRIEHGDMLGSANIARAARLGIIVVQNPAHFMIAETFRQRIGERIQQTTRVKDIAASDVGFALGSDGPLNPFLNMMFATMNAVNPAQALTIEQALVAYTAGSAAAEHAEDRKGKIETGMLADLAVLSQDIFKVAPPDLPRTSSVLTIVDGRIVVDRINPPKPAPAPRAGVRRSRAFPA